MGRDWSLRKAIWLLNTGVEPKFKTSHRFIELKWVWVTIMSKSNSVGGSIV